MTPEFNPKDPSVRKVMIDVLGVPEEVIADGKITRMEGYDSEIPTLILSAISGIDNYISADEAKAVLDAYDYHGPAQYKTILDGDSCPGSSPFGSVAVFGNLMAENFELRLFSAISPEQFCNFTTFNEFDPLMTRGIHFDERMVPERIAEFGRAVVRITMYEDWQQTGGGSAVLVSDEGDIVTARHVIFDKEGELRENCYIGLEGQEILIQPKHIIQSDEGEDFASLRISDLSGHYHLKPAALPPLPDETVWAIGYPGTMMRENWGTKTFTIGAVKYLEDKGLFQVLTDVRMAHGYSGGAMINERGEIVGVNSFIVTKGFVNSIVVRTDDSSSVMDPELFTASPREMSLFKFVLEELSARNVPADLWRSSYEQIKGNLLEFHPSFVEGGSMFTDHEMERIVNRIEEALAGLGDQPENELSLK